jgi:hypothetical protein
MKFKYYHGTSSIFLESIRKNGLGKINPNLDLNLLDVLKYLRTIAEKNISKSEDYLKLQETTFAMCNQVFLKKENENGEFKTFNFRHTNIHVSLSKERAITHIAINKYGSEILGRCIDIYKLLKFSNVEFEIPVNINKFGFEKYIDSDPKRIIIEILEVDENRLDKDDGKTAKEALDYLRTQIPRLDKETKFNFFQYCNFELLCPIEPKHLKFYELDFEGYPGNVDFEYTLSKI